MRIGICGTHATGKTTVLNYLRSIKRFENYTFCVECTREVMRLGLSINENGTDTTQKLIMQSHVFNLYMYEDMITDRTAYDGLAYSRYLFSKQSITAECMDHVQKVFNKTYQDYDIIFHIKPEFDVIDDGVRSMNSDFRVQVDIEFDSILSEFPPNRLCMLTGSVENRAAQIINFLENLK